MEARGSERPDFIGSQNALVSRAGCRFETARSVEHGKFSPGGHT